MNSRNFWAIACGATLVCMWGGRAAAQGPGAAEIERMLLAQPTWVSTWTHANNEDWSNPVGTGVATFVVRNGKLHEDFENRRLNQKCTGEVLVHDDGLTRFGCTRVEKRLKFDAKDSRHPFKGVASNGYAYRLSPRL